MPIYEYRCSGCDQQFEKIVLGKSQEIECPNCGGKEVTTVLSTFAVSSGSAAKAAQETGPCACGAPRRGMCGE